MENCRNCGAPPLGGTTCKYCGTYQKSTRYEGKLPGIYDATAAPRLSGSNISPVLINYATYPASIVSPLPELKPEPKKLTQKQKEQFVFLAIVCTVLGIWTYIIYKIKKKFKK